MASSDVANIRVRYSILVNYFSRIVRLASTTVSTIIITRYVSITEYGLMGLMLSTYNIITYAYSMWDWWVYRYYARRMYRYASAAFLMNIIYAIVATPLYIAVGYYYVHLTGFGFTAFVLMSITIVIASLHIYLQYIARASRPYIIGYTVTLSEIARTSFVYIFLYSMGYGLNGIIYSIILSRIIAVFIYIYYLFKEKLLIPPPRFYFDEIKTLLQNIYIQLTAYIANLIMQSERHIVTILSRSIQYSAYMTISYLPRNIILGNTFAFSAGLTARLLRGKSRVDVEDTLRIVFLINTLQIALMFIYAMPIIVMLNPIYIKAYPVFILYSIESYFASINNIFFSILTGTDKSDIERKGLGLLRSNIFLVILLNLARNIASVLAGTAWFIYSLSVGYEDNILCIIMYPVSWIVTILVLIAYTWRKATAIIRFKMPRREIVAAIIGGIGAVYYAIATKAYAITSTSFWSTLLQVAPHMLVSTVIYIVIVLCISSWSRKIIRNALAKKLC